MKTIESEEQNVIDRDFIRHAMAVSTVELDFSKIERKVAKFPAKQLKKLRASYAKALKDNHIHKKALNDAYLERRIADNLHNGDNILCH